MLALVCVLSAGLAAAQAPGTPPASEQPSPTPGPLALSDGRLELGTALSARRATLRHPALTTSFRGLSPAHLRLAGAAFLRGLALGASAELTHEQFTAVGADLAGDERHLGLRASSLSLAAVGRLRPVPALALEGHLGYGAGTLPLLDSSAGTLQALSIPHHGWLMAAVLGYDAGGPVAARLSARVMPVALGRHASLGPVQLVRAGLGAQVAVGGWAWAGARWHAVADWTLDWAAGSAGGTPLSQTAHRFGLGLRGSFGDVPGGARARSGAPRTVRGRVTYGDTGEPAAGARVAIAGEEAREGQAAVTDGEGQAAVTDGEGQAAVTDAQGVFTLRPRRPGTLRLVASVGGYRPAEQTLQVPEGGDVGDVQVALVLVRPSGPGRILGTVRLVGPDGSTQAAADVPVESPGQPPVRTDADGRFALESVGPGPVSVSVRARGHRGAEEVVVVPPGGEATLEVALQKVARGTPAWLKGQVRTARGRPLTGATLRVTEARASARTDRQGRFQLRLPGGRYTVLFTAPGHVSQSRVVEVADGDQAIFHIQLSAEEP